MSNINTPFEFKKKLTTKQKKYANFKEMKKRAEDWVAYMDRLFSKDKQEEILINLKLINGEIDIEKMYDNPMEVSMGKETVQLDYQDITHTPLIAQVTNAFIGEISKLLTNLTVKDLSPSRATFLKKEAANRLASYFENRVQVLRQNIMQTTMQKYGITDPFVDPEAQMQIQQEVDSEVQSQTPKDIFDFLINKTSTPKARGAQKILDTLSLKRDVKDENIQGLKYLLASGEEIMYSGREKNDVTYEAVNPMFFQAVGSLETEWYQHHRAAMRVKWMHKDDVIQTFAEELSKADIDKLDNNYELMGSRSGYWYDYDKNNEIKNHQFVMTQKGNIERLRDIDINTREGQAKYKALTADLFEDSAIDYMGSQLGIKVTHVVYREKRKLYKVGRYLGDEIKFFYISEEYVENEEEDEVVEEIWVDEVWEDYIIGTYDCIHVRTRPIPYQFLDPDNPYLTDLPYCGKKVGTNKGVNKPIIFVNLGKSSQKDFDITIASIKHEIYTEIGSVFTLLMQLKPDNYSWQDFVDSIRNLHMMPLDIAEVVKNPLAAQFLKEINIKSASGLAGKLQVAEMHKQMLYTSMLFNAERVGIISQYANGTNATASQTASYNQTTYLVQQHLGIVNKAMTQLLNVGASYYKDNPEKAAMILDDLSLADLVTSGESGYPYHGITIADNFEEEDIVKLLKSYALAFIQNSQNHLAVMDVILAKTETEIRDIMAQEAESTKKLREEEMQFRDKQLQTEQQTKIQLKDMEDKKEFQINEAKLANALERTMLSRENFLLANDVNKDGQSDLLTGKILELRAKMEMHKDNLKLEEKKLEKQ